MVIVKRLTVNDGRSRLSLAACPPNRIVVRGIDGKAESESEVHTLLYRWAMLARWGGQKSWWMCARGNDKGCDRTGFLELLSILLYQRRVCNEGTARVQVLMDLPSAW